MKARKMVLTLLLFSLLSALWLVSSTDLVLKESDIAVYGISVLVPDENDECWVNFKKGMDRAAVEFNADISFVTLYDRSRPDQQGSLLLREIENGAQAVIVCPSDDEIIAAALEQNSVSQPVFTVTSRIGAPQVKGFIGSSRRQMGELLASAIRQDSRRYAITKVTAVSSPGAREDIESAFAGLEAKLSGSGISLSREYILTSEDAALLAGRFNPAGGEALAALDASAMQTLAAEIRPLPPERQALYGIGCTNSIIRGLEDGAIRAIVAPNDYDAGYLSVKAAAEYLEYGGTSEFTTGSALIRGDEIYDKDKEMLLFPIQ